jgi:hypothetical protein
MILDHRKDFQEIYAHLVERVKAFDGSTNQGPGDGDSPGAMIDFGFQCDQAGWVVLVFDTRPDAELDGEWNSFIEENLFERPHWQEAFESLDSGPVSVLLPDGTMRTITSETEFDDFVALFGDLLKGVLMKALTDGIFTALPKSTECHLGVQEQSGDYGWPNHEDRGKENFA